MRKGFSIFARASGAGARGWGCRSCDLLSACRHDGVRSSLDGLLPDDPGASGVEFRRGAPCDGAACDHQAVDERPGHPPADPRILLALSLYATVEAPARLRGCVMSISHLNGCGTEWE